MVNWPVSWIKAHHSLQDVFLDGTQGNLGKYIGIIKVIAEKTIIECNFSIHPFHEGFLTPMMVKETMLYAQTCQQNRDSYFQSSNNYPYL